MNIAIMGATGTGKTWLANELSRHCPAVLITDSPSFLAALAGAHPCDPGALHVIAREHQRRYDLTLLTGLDLPGDAASQGRNEVFDAALRLALDGAGIAYQVIYGRGAQRALNAVKLVLCPDEPADQVMATEPSSSAKWVWSCETCSDPVCEHRLFTDKLGIRQP